MAEKQLSSKCPKCGRPIHAGARLCGYCWMRATPGVNATDQDEGARGPGSLVAPKGAPWWRFWA